jgi:DNA adenine methylase Dam
MMYIEPPFNYTGSKFKLLSQIIPKFDYSKNAFIDLFGGGGSVYCNILDKFKLVFYNDIIEDLVNAHHGMILNSSAFIDKVKALSPKDKEDSIGYANLRKDYNNNPTPEKLYSLMCSCTNNMMRFNKSFKFNQTFGKRRFNDHQETKLNNYVRHIHNFANYNFSSCRFDNFNFPTGNDYFVYMDPPYSNTSAGYNSFWNKDDDQKLYKLCLTLHENRVTFMLSGVRGEHDGRCFLIDKLSENFKVTDINHDYEKVARNKNSKQSQEVIITNYDVNKT